MSREPTWAVQSDYLGVIKTEDGFGAFPDELAALNYQISLLDSEIYTHKLARRIAVRRRSQLERRRLTT